MSGAAWQVEVVSGPEAGRRLAVHGGALTLGRAADNGLVLADDATVSGHHAVLTHTAGGWTLQDLGSKNGCFVEDSAGRVRVDGLRRLAEGQIFYLGSAGVRIIGQIALASPSSSRDSAMLRVEFTGSELRYHLWSAAATGSQYSCACTRAELAALQRNLDAAVLSRHVTGLSGTLHEAAEALAHHLVPSRLRERLEVLTGQALVVGHPPALLGVPWELVPLADAPLGVKLPVSRQVILNDQSIARPPLQDHPPKWLFVANPTGDLPQAQDAAEALLEQVTTRMPLTEAAFLAGERVTRMGLLQRLAAADIVYYTGHAAFDPGDPPASGWRLDDGMLTGRDVARLARFPRFVFANACASGREPLHDCPRLEEHSAGFAGSLLRAGVSHYLGSLWPVAAGPAAVFGGEVLHALLMGTEIAPAVQLARRMLWQTFPDDPAWAGYILLGDPAWRLANVSG